MANNHGLSVAICTFALVAMCSAAFNYPTYSLDKMPTTRFTCRDKILGGYYADAETQCQMFHVCVKVAGVGVQDFRFLCPNGTAFDQEAQTCADWGDVDCESATLYYGSDNFDLYRVGSGFESKRAPLADEEEATFHLQRAETSDARRSKQVVVNQKSRVQSATPNYHTTNSHFNTFNSVQTFDKTTSRYQPPASSLRPSTPPPPRPTTPSTTTTTTTTTTTPVPTTTRTITTPRPYSAAPQQFNGQQMNYQEAIRLQSGSTSSSGQNYNPYATYNHAQGSRGNAYTAVPTQSPQTTQNTQRPIQQQVQQRQTSFPSPTTSPVVAQYNFNDDIFRGSYSSNFFNNKNNGKEDFEAEYIETKNKPSNPTKATQKSTTSAASSSRARLVNRGRVTYNSSQRGTGRNNFNVIGSGQKSTTAYQPVTTTTTTPAVTRIQNVNGRNYDNIRSNAQRNQQKTAVTPVTYRPSTISSSSFRVPVTKLPTSVTTSSPINPEDQFYDVPRKRPGKIAPFASFIPTTQRPPATTSSTVLQPFQSKFNPNANYELTAVQQSKFTYNPFGELRVSPSAPERTTTPATTTTTSPAPKIPFFPTPAPQPIQKSSPRGFEVIPITQQPQASFQHPQQQQPQRPQPFSRRSDTKTYTPSSIKKFSTLVPRDQYDPTTFKPSTYKKPVDNFAATKTGQQDFLKIKAVPVKYNPTNFVTAPSTTSAPTMTTTTTSTTTTTTTPRVPVFNYSPTFPPTPSPFQSSSNHQFNVPQFQQQQGNLNTFNAPSGPFQSSPPVQQQQQFHVSTSTTASYPNHLFNAFNQVASSAAAAPLKIEEIDEDDGQYHPELYEKDFARYKIMNRKSNKIVSPAAQYFPSTAAPSRAVGIRTHFQKPVVPASASVINVSGEDEFLKTAHSQNIVASGNELLYDSIKNGFKQQQQAQRQTTTTSVAVQKQSTVASPRPFSIKTAPTIPPNATTTKRPAKKPKVEKDVSYDYQYYDFGVDGGQRDYEFDLLEDFGKLKKTKKQ